MRNRAVEVIPVLTGVAVVTGALTGFGGGWVYGAVAGWGLLFHMVAGAVVMLGLALIGLLWGGAHRLERRGIGIPRGWVRDRNLAPAPAATREIGVVRKGVFWLLMICGLGAMGTMLAAMLPAFGYVGQDRLLTGHAWSSVGVVLAGGGYWALARRGIASSEERIQKSEERIEETGARALRRVRE